MFLRSTRYSRIWLTLVFLFISVFLFAQKTKSQLEQEKRDNLKKIAEAEKILSETESQKKVTVGQLNALNEQIKARQSLISALNLEINLLTEEIAELGQVIDALETDLTNLKEEYAAMVYAAYKSNHGFDLLTFIFSAETFNQLFMRIKYMEQYTEARKLQAQQIVAVTDALNLQKERVQSKREEQSALLKIQVQENRKLLTLKTRQSKLIAELTKKGNQLRTEMGNRKIAVDRLDKLIADLISDEINRNRSMSNTDVADEAKLTELFESEKDKLAWPVTSGFISSQFGRRPHPVLKAIMVENTGVDIQTSEGADVVSIFDGEVKTKAFVPGMYNVVIVKHGVYYTVYSKLKEVVVEKGQILKANDTIGKVHTDVEGVSEVHFEVWKNTQKLDPEKWLIN